MLSHTIRQSSQAGTDRSLGIVVSAELYDQRPASAWHLCQISYRNQGFCPKMRFPVDKQNKTATFYCVGPITSGYIGVASRHLILSPSHLEVCYGQKF
jgi:hypothetical protein